MILVNYNVISKSDPSVYEIESILREWTTVWFKNYEVVNYNIT